MKLNPVVKIDPQLAKQMNVNPNTTLLQAISDHKKWQLEKLEESRRKVAKEGIKALQDILK